MLKPEIFTLKMTMAINEKKSPRLGENISKGQSAKGLLSKTYKELLKLNNRGMNSPIKKKNRQSPGLILHKRRY